MNLLFFGNWGLGKLVLEGLLVTPGINVCGVVTQYDPANTDHFFNIVHDTATYHNIPVYHELEVLPDELLNSADLGLSVVFNQLFKASLLARLRVLNVHPSMLPAYRSSSPSLWQIRDRATAMGITIHAVDEGIDTGPVYRQTSFPVDYEQPYSEFIDTFNIQAAAWVISAIASFHPEYISPPRTHRARYYPRIRLPQPLADRSLREVGDFLNRQRICVFSGNRAEFGIVYPLIVALSKKYNVDIVISGGHTQAPWNTKHEVYTLLSRDRLPVNVHEVDGTGIKDHYRDSFVLNYQFGYSYFKQFKEIYPIDLCIVMGDRVETYSFANAAFFNNVPLCHLFGGDIANVPYFDTNIRHAITKIANLHFASNQQSLKTLLRLGEEPWRCALMGNVSLDNFTNGNVASYLELAEQYGLAEESTLLMTYHPSQYVDEHENYRVFRQVLDAILAINIQTIITYPNNDDGHRLITEYLESQPRRAGKVCIVPSLGIRNYLGVLQSLPCIVVGNSSSGLLETAYTGTPTINVGDRQTDRPRAVNVLDVPLDQLDFLPDMIRRLLADYVSVKQANLKDRFFFGEGRAVKIAMENIGQFLTLDKQSQIFKKFV